MPNSIIGAFGFPQTGQQFDAREFEKQYEQAVLSTRSTEPEFKQKKSFSPSLVGYGHGTCPRYWHIAFTGAEFTDTFDSQGIANMDGGNDSHTRIQNIMAKMGVLKDHEFKIINDSPPIFGYGDALINWNGTDVVGEIKTAKAESFNWRQSTGKPVVYHLIQLLIYMKVLGIPEGFLFYENRNDGQILVVPVSLTNRNQEIADAVFDWMTAVHDNWKEGGPIPERPFKKTTKSSPCHNCPVFDTCWNKLDDGEPGLGKLPVEEFKK
jgi:CRISPR/Cas system-associated exonuclease Cas4 (RecB family)